MIISFWSYETCSLAHELSNVVEEGTPALQYIDTASS
jgi:hypothetical protein